MTFKQLSRGKKWLLGIVIVLIIINLLIVITGKSFVYKALAYNFADIDDYKIFPNRTIDAAKKPQPWPVSRNLNSRKPGEDLNKLLLELESVALLVIQNDSIQYEQYWDGYGPASYSNSFSMAKSYVSAMTGIALKEGKIKSVEQSVGSFLPEFKEGDKAKIKVKHLLSMSSGLNWDESYANPLSTTTEAYYGNDLHKLINHLKAVEEPGINFSYKSGDTQILSFVLEKATGKKISDFAEEKIWNPLGCEHSALWSLDAKDGYEKGYCCLNSNARDFARFGLIYLNKGKWKGKQLIPASYVEQSITPGNLKYQNRVADFYGYQWWIIPEYKGEKIYYCRGILGQYIIVIPSKNAVVVRLGNKRGKSVGDHYEEVFKMIDWVKEKY